MTSEQAYAAMYFFLEDMYARTRSDELGGLLGDLSLLGDGLPADRAVAADWQRAVEKAMKEGRAGTLELGRQ